MSVTGKAILLWVSPLLERECSGESAGGGGLANGDGHHGLPASCSGECAEMAGLSRGCGRARLATSDRLHGNLGLELGAGALADRWETPRSEGIPAQGLEMGHVKKMQTTSHTTLAIERSQMTHNAIVYRKMDPGRDVPGRSRPS